MGFIKQSTTNWKRENGLRSINFCMPIALLQELDTLRLITGSTRSEALRSSVRIYIKERMNQLADQERKALEAYIVRQQNQNRQMSTGLLPDY